MFDIFINPSKKSYKNDIIEKQQTKAKDYFKRSNMQSLYPNLFEILWYASLPCSPMQGLDTEFMIKSCELAGKKINCSKIFTKDDIYETCNNSFR